MQAEVGVTEIQKKKDGDKVWKKSLFMLIVVPGHTKKNEIGRGRMRVTC